MRRIQPKDNEGFSFIRNKLVHTGKPPSLRTIAAFLGYKSPRSVQLMLERLRDEGRIYYKGGEIKLVHQPDASGSETTRNIPVVGTVAAGNLTLAEQVVDDYIKVSTKLAKPGHDYFILRVKGNSMNRSGINDGDLALVRQQPDAREGEIIVALVDDEATVKYFHRDRGVVVLKPNSTDGSFKPIILSDQLIIQGVVVETIPNPF
jgi:repressor LexA